jgi:hypothetical protein
MDRQAIIVVHGVGEQRPGQMLRRFAELVVDEEERRLFVKPDRLSGLDELQIVTVPRADSERPTTDIYELYWADLVRDTTLAQVGGWLLRVLLAPSHKFPVSHLPERLFIRCSGIILTVALLGLWCVGTLKHNEVLAGLGAGLVPFAMLRLIASILARQGLLGYAGDAARYFEARPDNIGKREAIRKRGLSLLDRIHESGRYRRLIVYGHSLGSVIAFDVLARWWALNFRRRSDTGRPENRAIAKLQKAFNQHEVKGVQVPLAEIQELQFEAWKEHRRNGFPWLITDFVSAGSPLALAPVLLDADTTTDYSARVADRTFPTCPPQADEVTDGENGVRRKSFLFTHAVKSSHPTRHDSAMLPHHSGLFAITRWSNLYFPLKGLLQGDPLGGKLAPVLGRWINDIDLPPTRGFAHTKYTSKASNAADRASLDQVRRALNLPFRLSLQEYLELDKAK